MPCFERREYDKSCRVRLTTRHEVRALITHFIKLALLLLTPRRTTKRNGSLMRVQEAVRVYALLMFGAFPA